MRYLYLYFIFLSLWIASCNSPAGGQTALLSPNLINENIYAQNFSIEKRENYNLVKVWGAQNAPTDTMSYVLYKNDKPKTIFARNVQYIKTPVKRIVCLSSTHIGFLSALNAKELIVGISQSKYVYDEFVSRNAAEVGESSTLDVEKILSIKPDLIISSGVEESTSDWQRIKDYGVPVMHTTEYNEKTPLGRAEWIKLFGVLTGLDSSAKTFFSDVTLEYEGLLKNTEVQEESLPPTNVLLGLPYKGQWYIPGGNSFVAQYIKDADGTYPWAETSETGSIALSFEEVYAKAKESDVWIDVVFAKSYSDLEATDIRLKNFLPFSNQQIFNYNKRIAANGAFDFFESGVAQPQVVLKDFIKMLHPDRLPDHEFYYYMPLKTLL